MPILGLDYYEYPYQLVSGSWDSTIKFWNFFSGQCLNNILVSGRVHSMKLVGVKNQLFVGLMYGSIL